jgi:DegV family protein with EDD domain
MAEQYRIAVVPLQVILGAQTFRDKIDLTEEEFFEKAKTLKVLPKTSQPPPGDFEKVYRELAADPDVDSIISAHISSKLSGTYSAAATAGARVQEEVGKRISVIDTMSAYMGNGFMLVNGARAAEKGSTHDEIVQQIIEAIPRTRIMLLVDTLEYLQRGGRIGGAQAFVGTLLNIKPILHVKNGRVEPLERVRTRHKAMERLVEIAAGEVGSTPIQLAVGNAQCPEDAATLSAMARAKLDVVEEVESELGPAISAHTGPGVLGFVYHRMK